MLIHTSGPAAGGDLCLLPARQQGERLRVEPVDALDQVPLLEAEQRRHCLGFVAQGLVFVQPLRDGRRLDLLRVGTLGMCQAGLAGVRVFPAQ